MNIESLITNHQDLTALVAGAVFALVIIMIIRHLKKIVDSQVSLVGFIDTDDGSMLPLRNTRGDKRVRVAGKRLLATKVVVTRFERGYPVYREV